MLPTLGVGVIFLFWSDLDKSSGLRLDSHENKKMSVAIFSPNGKNFVHFMSIFVPKPDLLAHFRVEHFLTIFDFNQVAIFPYKTASVWPFLACLVALVEPFGAKEVPLGAKKEPLGASLALPGATRRQNEHGTCPRRVP